MTIPYTEPFDITESTVLKVIAVDGVGVRSEVIELHYVIDPEDYPVDAVPASLMLNGNLPQHERNIPVLSVSALSAIIGVKPDVIKEVTVTSTVGNNLLTGKASSITTQFNVLSTQSNFQITTNKPYALLTNLNHLLVEAVPALMLLRGESPEITCTFEAWTDYAASMMITPAGMPDVSNPPARASPIEIWYFTGDDWQQSQWITF